MAETGTFNDETRPLVDVSVVLPVHNEADHLEAEVKRIAAALNDSTFTYEIIVVDDGSTDDSPIIAGRLSDIRLIRFSSNRGSGSARKYGTLAASGRVVVWTETPRPFRMTWSRPVAPRSGCPFRRMRRRVTLQ